MRYMKLYTIFLAFLFLVPFVSSVAEASDLSKQFETITNVQFNNPASAYYNVTANVMDDATNSYNNYLYTGMNTSFNNSGKYIYPLSSPFEVRPDNMVSNISFSTRFSLSNDMYSGISDFWIRLPFTIGVSITTGLHPPANSMPTGNYTVKLYRGYGNTNISDMNHIDVSLDTDSTVVYDRDYDGNNGNNKYYKAYPSPHTRGDIQLYFVWLRISAPIQSGSNYILYVNNNDGYNRNYSYFPSNGDSFADNRYGSVLKLGTGDTTYYPIDFDLSIFIIDILHDGLVSYLVDGYGAWSQFYFDNFNSTGVYFNFICPVMVDNDNITIDTRIFYDGGFDDYSNETPVIDGKGYAHVSIDPVDGKNIYRIRVLISTTGGNDFIVYLADSYLCEAPLLDNVTSNKYPFRINTGSDRYINSGLILYSYISLDPFSLSYEIFHPNIIGYPSTGNILDDLHFISLQSIVLNARDESNQRNHAYSLMMREKLKIMMGLAYWPLKIIDLALEGVAWIGERVWEFVTDRDGLLIDVLDWPTWLKDLADGIIYAIGLFIEIAETVIQYGPYVLYMSAKILGVFIAISLAVIVLNGVDAVTKDIINGTPFLNLAVEWPKTRSIIGFYLAIATYIALFVFNIVQAVIPF